MHLNELKALHVAQLLEMAAGLEIENANRLRKQELMFAIMKRRAKQGEQIFGDGVLEVLPDGFGFLRSPETRSEERTSELQSLMRISYAVFCLKKKTQQYRHNILNIHKHQQT